MLLVCRVDQVLLDRDVLFAVDVHLRRPVVVVGVRAQDVVVGGGLPFAPVVVYDIVRVRQHGLGDLVVVVPVVVVLAAAPARRHDPRPLCLFDQAALDRVVVAVV